MVKILSAALLISTVLGFLSGLGVGGGSLLMLWLTAVVGMEQDAARSVNLLFFLPSALTACVFRWKQGVLRWKKIMPCILGGCVSAGLFSLVSLWVDTALIRKLFGILLIAAGLSELLHKKESSSP